MSEEVQEYVTLDQAAEIVGLKKVSLYYYIRELGIETKKFRLNRHKYISKKDVEQIRDLKEHPWKLEDAKKQRDDDAALRGCTSNKVA